MATGSVLQVNVSQYIIAYFWHFSQCFLQDCIICDGSNVSGNVKSCIVGRGQEVSVLLLMIVLGVFCYEDTEIFAPPYLQICDIKGLGLAFKKDKFDEML